MIWVGIDTGVNTGIAVWDSGKRELLSLDTVTIDEALFRVLGLVAEYQDIRVVVEDARLRRWVPDTHTMSARRWRAALAPGLSSVMPRSGSISWKG